MNDSIKEGCIALFEGNRDAILKLFPSESDDINILWLKANAVEEISEKKRLLEKILTFPNSDIRVMALSILERENKFEIELSIPPSYKFWKKGGTLANDT